MTMYKPKVRRGFSDRNNIEVINKVIQKDDLDERTRNGIVNIIDYLIDNLDERNKLDDFYEYVYKVIFRVTKDEIPKFDSERRYNIVEGIKHYWEYHDIFSFLEEGIRIYIKMCYDDSVYNIFNEFFEKECVGYRFIDGNITDIIDKEEIDEIEEALNNKYFVCKESIKKAIDHLYNRENPDYANSVKESITAIESMCNIILETKNKTLGDALNKLESKGIIIHGALKSAFSSLYGYTSDKTGIRHGGKIDEKTTFEEAKFMLVACSAFLNYLISVYEKSL